MRAQFLLIIIQIFIVYSNGKTTLRVRLNQESFTFTASVVKEMVSFRNFLVILIH